ncbi:helix-turn-helix domain-containing protein, partial [Microvirga sp. BT689]
MGDNVWRPAHLTQGQMEERRLAAATLLRQGRLSQAEIARHLGVSPASVSRWAGRLAQQGRRGLEAQPILVVWMRDLLGVSDDLEGLRQSVWIGWL